MTAQSIFGRDIIETGGDNLRHLMSSLATIYGADRRWSVGELHAALDLSREPSMRLEVEIVLRYYKSLSNKTMFPNKVSRLLEDWTGACDCARRHAMPRGTCKDPIEINRRKMEAEMLVVKARSYDFERKEWLSDARAVNDRVRFDELRRML